MLLIISAPADGFKAAESSFSNLSGADWTAFGSLTGA